MKQRERKRLVVVEVQLESSGRFNVSVMESSGPECSLAAQSSWGCWFEPPLLGRVERLRVGCHVGALTCVGAVGSTGGRRCNRVSGVTQGKPQQTRALEEGGSSPTTWIRWRAVGRRRPLLTDGGILSQMDRDLKQGDGLNWTPAPPTHTHTHRHRQPALSRGFTCT